MPPAITTNLELELTFLTLDVFFYDLAALQLFLVARIFPVPPKSFQKSQLPYSLHDEPLDMKEMPARVCATGLCGLSFILLKPRNDSFFLFMRLCAFREKQTT